MRSMLITLLATACCLTLPSCLIGTRSHSERTGTYVSAETLSKVQPGANQDLVRDLLGNPSSRVTLDDGGQVWKWSYKTETNGKDTVFLLIGSRHSNTEEGSAYVEFDTEGQVLKSWRD